MNFSKPKGRSLSVLLRSHFRRKLRTWLSLVLASSLSLLLLNSACVPTDRQVTLRFIVPQLEVGIWQEIIQAFQASDEGEGITVELDTSAIPDDPDDTDSIRRAYVSSLEADDPADYDLIYSDIIWVPELAGAGWLEDLSDDFSEEDRQDFLPQEIELGQYEDRLYRIPFRSDAGVLYYRQDLLDLIDESPPDSFDDLLRISQTLQAMGEVRTGYLWQGRESEALIAVFAEVLASYGGFWIDPSTTEAAVGLDQPAALEAVSFLRETLAQGVSPLNVLGYSEAETRERFMNAEAVFMRNWPNAWAEVNGEASRVQGRVGMMPMVSATGQAEDRKACHGGWGFSIAHNSRHKQAALAAIKFFTDTPTQRQFTLGYSGMPSRHRLFFDPQVVAEHGHYPDLLEIVQADGTWVARPPVPEYPQASCILQRALGTALDLSVSSDAIAEVMTAAAAETRWLLGEEGVDLPDSWRSGCLNAGEA